MLELSLDVAQKNSTKETLSMSEPSLDVAQKPPTRRTKSIVGKFLGQVRKKIMLSTELREHCLKSKLPEKSTE